MKSIQSNLFLLVALLSIGLIITSCAVGVGPERENAEKELRTLTDMGASAEDIAEVEALIAEAEELLAAGDTLGARKKLEEARYRAIELQGALQLANRDDTRDFPEGTPIEIGLVDILFDYDQSRVRPDAGPALSQNARIIKENSGRISKVIIEGYCDTRGTDEYNLALADKRAKSVEAYLAGIGVDVNIIESVGKGETDEWGSDASESSFSKNRRAHFKVLASGGSDDSMTMESDDSMMTE